MRYPFMFLLVSVLSLSACNPQQTELLQQETSAALGEIQENIQEASSSIGELKQQASAAMGLAQQVGAIATTINPELKEKVEALKQQASAAKEILHNKPNP